MISPHPYPLPLAGEGALRFRLEALVLGLILNKCLNIFFKGVRLSLPTPLPVGLVDQLRYGLLLGIQRNPLFCLRIEYLLVSNVRFRVDEHAARRRSMGNPILITRSK